jgi:hypothetical protein
MSSQSLPIDISGTIAESPKTIIIKEIHLPPSLSTVSYCLCRPSDELTQFQLSFQNIIDKYDDSKMLVTPIKNRFIFCYKKLHKKVAMYKFLYFLGHSIVTIGSLIVPALLSIQYNTGEITNTNSSYIIGIYWSTWVLSLLVTIFNGILTLFKIDRNYYLYNIYLEKLKSETYQYFSLSGRYTGHHSGDNYRQRTFMDQLIVYSYILEKIYMKLVENEFAQVEDNTQDKTNSQKKDMTQPPDKQIGLSPTNPLQIRQEPFESLVSPRNVGKNESSTDDSESTSSTGKNNEVVQPDLENQIKRVVQKLFLKDGGDENATVASELEDVSGTELIHNNKVEMENKKIPQKKPWK